MYSKILQSHRMLLGDWALDICVWLDIKVWCRACMYVCMCVCTMWSSSIWIQQHILRFQNRLIKTFHPGIFVLLPVLCPPSIYYSRWILSQFSFPIWLICCNLTQVLPFHWTAVRPKDFVSWRVFISCLQFGSSNGSISRSRTKTSQQLVRLMGGGVVLFLCFLGKCLHNN